MEKVKLETLRHPTSHPCQFLNQKPKQTQMCNESVDSRKNPKGSRSRKNRKIVKVFKVRNDDGCQLINVKKEQRGVSSGRVKRVGAAMNEVAQLCGDKRQ